MRTKLTLEELVAISECLDVRLKISNVIEPDSDLSRIEDLKTLIDASISAEKERVRQSELFDFLFELNKFKTETQN